MTTKEMSLDINVMEKYEPHDIVCSYDQENEGKIG